jgi:hypothetical protein
MSLENNFKEKLYDLETPLGGNVSFEKVMAMRRKKGAPIWWKPAILVVATMSAVTLTGFLWFGNGSSRLTKSTNPPIVAKQNPTNKQGANISTDIESNTQNVATPNVAPQTNAAEKSSNSRRGILVVYSFALIILMSLISSAGFPTIAFASPESIPATAKGVGVFPPKETF